MSCGITGHSPPPHPAVSRSMAGWRKAIGGSARRSRGVRIQANAQTPIRLYRAVKTQGRRRKEGEDCLSKCEFRRPQRWPWRQTVKPDNCGGASGFVLLATEMNEQIKWIYVTGTFFGRESNRVCTHLSIYPHPNKIKRSEYAILPEPTRHEAQNKSNIIREVTNNSKLTDFYNNIFIFYSKKYYFYTSNHHLMQIIYKLYIQNFYLCLKNIIFY